MKSEPSWFWRVLLTIDQSANVIFAPILNLFVQGSGAKFGDEDETLSSVFGKNVRSGTCRLCTIMCRLLHWLDKGHCEKSIETDEGTPNE